VSLRGVPLWRDDVAILILDLCNIIKVKLQFGQDGTKEFLCEGVNSEVDEARSLTWREISPNRQSTKKAFSLFVNYWIVALPVAVLRRMLL
jgi:hypothetical protein